MRTMQEALQEAEKYAPRCEALAARMEEGRGVLEQARAEQAERTRAEASGPAAPPATEPLLHWTQIKIPPNPTSGTPQEMQAARKERQRVRRLYEAARLRAGE